MTYVEKLARLREIEDSLPARTYITNDEFRKQKTALTRAINSEDPEKVLKTVEKTLKEWEGKVWPDNWAQWRNALEDAALNARMAGLRADTAGDEEQYERLTNLSYELEAASVVLFP